MRLAFLSLALYLLTPTAECASKKSAVSPAEVPIYVEYKKTGLENDEAAAKLGQKEVENSNPCVLQMRRDVEALESREELRDAVAMVKKDFDDPKPSPRLVLHFMNEAIELRFEMWSKPLKYQDGVVYDVEHLKYRKAVYITDQPGSWQQRLDGEQCHVSEARFIALIDELREADRLAACKQRKLDLLSSSAKVSNYIHNYLPVAWLDEARRRLILQNAPVGDLLRADTSVYREGNGTFHECQRGLRLLEEEAASSVRVMNEVRDEHKGTDVPSDEIEQLERLLTGIAK